MVQRIPELSSFMSKLGWVDITVLDAGPRGERYETLWAVCQACCHPDPESQPTMAAIVEAFENGDLVRSHSYPFSFLKSYTIHIYGLMFSLEFI